MSHLHASCAQSVAGFLHVLLENMSQGVLFINMQGDILVMNQTAQEYLQVKKLHLPSSFFTHMADDVLGFSMKRWLFSSISKEIKEQVYIHKAPFFVTAKRVQIPVKGALILLEYDRKLLKKTGEEKPIDVILERASVLKKKEKTRLFAKSISRLKKGMCCLVSAVEKAVGCLKPAEPRIVFSPIQAPLQKALRLLKKDAFPEKKIRLDLRIPEEKIYTWIDPCWMQRAFHNLLVNAMESFSGKGVLTVTVFTQERYTTVTISDTGIGIDPSIQKNIFSPFFSAKDAGYGSGLYETKKIIDAHQGSICCQSHLGKGSCFTLKIPSARRL